MPHTLIVCVIYVDFCTGVSLCIASNYTCIDYLFHRRSHISCCNIICMDTFIGEWWDGDVSVLLESRLKYYHAASPSGDLLLRYDPDSATFPFGNPTRFRFATKSTATHWSEAWAHLCEPWVPASGTCIRTGGNRDGNISWALGVAHSRAPHFTPCSLPQHANKSDNTCVVQLPFSKLCTCRHTRMRSIINVIVIHISWSRCAWGRWDHITCNSRRAHASASLMFTVPRFHELLAGILICEARMLAKMRRAELNLTVFAHLKWRLRRIRR